MNLDKFNTLVVKVGSHLLVNQDLSPNEAFFKALAGDIAHLLNRQKRVLLVSSGAVALGCYRTNPHTAQTKTPQDTSQSTHKTQGEDSAQNYPPKSYPQKSYPPKSYPKSLVEKQAYAAMGQIALANLWERHFGALGFRTAQVLLTLEDSENRRRYLNASATLDALGKMGVVAVINENDTIATDELRFGDNDRLAARVAQMSGADCLVILSTIDGFYNGDPAKGAAHIPLIKKLAQSHFAVAKAGSATFASGGMKTKLEAAKIATEAGVAMVIASGKTSHPLSGLNKPGTKATWFEASGDKTTAHKNWIAGRNKAAGEIVIDQGAAKALEQGASLLAVGCLALTGEFSRGDLVFIKNQQGELLAKGIAAHNKADALRCLGKSNAEVAKTLGYEGREELVHRNNLFLTHPSGRLAP